MHLGYISLLMYETIDWGDATIQYTILQYNEWVHVLRVTVEIKLKKDWQGCKQVYFIYLYINIFKSCT